MFGNEIILTSLRNLNYRVVITASFPHNHHVRLKLILKGLFSLIYTSNVLVGSIVSTNELISFDIDGNILNTATTEGFSGSLHLYDSTKMIIGADRKVFRRFYTLFTPSFILSILIFSYG